MKCQGNILVGNFFFVFKMVKNILIIVLLLVAMKLLTCDETLQILHLSRLYSVFEAGKDANRKPVRGIARIIQYVENRKKDYDNVFFFDTMDWFMGSVWYSIHRMKICKAFVDILPVDAIGLGHSEMFEGSTNQEKEENFKSYLKSICNKPILCANIIISDIEASKCVKSSTVLTANHLKVGVTAFVQISLTPVTYTTVKFTNELDAINRETKKLKKDGSDVVVVIAHCAYDFITGLVSSIQNVDVIVLGHSSKLLFNGSPPVGKATGNYPLQLTNADGKVTLVVSTGSSYYVGKLILTVSSDGTVQADPESNPEYMHSDIPENKEALELLEQFREKVDEKTREIVGRSTAFINGSCLLQECNMGNFVTDAIVEFRAVSYHTGGYWTDAPIAFLNAGNFRSDIVPQPFNKNSLTFADLVAALPFANLLHTFKINGSFLREALEHSVEQIDVDEAMQFLQVSGLHVTYDLGKPPLQRLVSVKARCAKCDIPVYEELEDSENYGVLTNSYIAKGGDGYKFDQIRDQLTLAGTDLDAVLQYTKNKLVYPGKEERIKILVVDKRRSSSKSKGSKEFPGMLYLIYIYNVFITVLNKM